MSASRMSAFRMTDSAAMPFAARAARLPRQRSRLWQAGALVVALAVSLPVLSIAWLALFPSENIWPHLASTVLPGYLENTALLMLGNGLSVLVIGTGTAWLVTMCRFPGRRLFEWLLLLPLSMPAYIVAFVYTDLLEFAGPVQRAAREVFGWESARDYWFPEIRSMGGAIFVMSFVLYPYVYLLGRAAFHEQSSCALEVSRTLGRGAWSTFWSVALPLARPALAAGTALALMETLADFGTVDFFAVYTLTLGVFNVWLNMGNAGGAAQIALVMLGAVVLLITLERASRRKQRHFSMTTRYRPHAGFTLTGWRAVLAAIACALPVLIGFGVPAAVLLDYAIRFFGDSWSGAYLEHARNSVMLSVTAAIAAVAVALFISYGRRVAGGPTLSAASRLAGAGYAIPGTVLAIGVIVPFAAFDNGLDAVMRSTFGISTGLLLSGTVAAIIFAYVVRFLAVALGAVEASLGRVRPTMDMAARSLGAGPGAILRRVHLPLVRRSLLAAATIVFVDCMKELPATLILRPFNFDTLATEVFQRASTEQLEYSALAALTIVAVGIVPVMLLSRAVGVPRPGSLPN
jgi:iron(III) transport system permease protein